MIWYGMLWYGKEEYDRVLYGSYVGKGDTQCVWYGMERFGTLESFMLERIVWCQAGALLVL